jgi:hypothetical protein
LTTKRPSVVDEPALLVRIVTTGSMQQRAAAARANSALGLASNRCERDTSTEEQI